MPRQEYPIARHKGNLGGVDINYRISMEVSAGSLHHWKQVNVPAADVYCDDSMIRIQVLPVGFKCLSGE